jgi:hypothetical protein
MEPQLAHAVEVGLVVFGQIERRLAVNRVARPGAQEWQRAGPMDDLARGIEPGRAFPGPKAKAVVFAGLQEVQVLIEVNDGVGLGFQARQFHQIVPGVRACQEDCPAAAVREVARVGSKHL